MKRQLVLVLVLFAFAPLPLLADQAALEANFAERMNGVIFDGNFTTVGPDGKAGPPKAEKYTVSSVKKTEGDVWIFNARIQYGENDVTVPIPLQVKWAGDTPVITLDSLAIPKLGTFSARVVIHEGSYAGTWSASDHGGHLYGRLTKAEAE